PPSSSIGSQNDDIDFPGICVKHDHPGGISVLLFDAHLYACRLCALPKVGQVLEPLGGPRGKSNVRRRCVKQKQLGVADRCEPERTVKRWLARLLEIDCTENPREVPHAATSMVIKSSPGSERNLRHVRAPVSAALQTNAYCWRPFTSQSTNAWPKRSTIRRVASVTATCVV